MIVDLRTYTVRPGTIGKQLAIYEKFAYPVQVRHVGEPLFYLTAESGEMNTIVHGWVYESAGDREARRAAMAKDPDWKVYLDENLKAGNIIAQRNSLMTPAPFAIPKIVR